MSNTRPLIEESKDNIVWLDNTLDFVLSSAKALAIPFVGIVVFLILWTAAAQSVKTSLGQFPGPAQVWEQFGSLYTEHQAARQKEAEFYDRQEVRNAKRLADDPSYETKIRAFTGKETFLDQIVTSLVTVMSGFLLAAVIAIPLGIAVGLNKTLNAAVNPIIQIFKPVSPLAWLPLVTILVSALYVTDDPMVAKAFIVSMITVTLCCVWPMVINTSVGVASIDSDLLIAAEMLAQNPGLGKFVWDEFQNGSSSSLSRIMAAVVVIGIIGFLLDRGMLLLQRWLSWDKASATR
jgi:nitrate/nitrite transport system permease protein